MCADKCECESTTSSSLLDQRVSLRDVSYGRGPFLVTIKKQKNKHPLRLLKIFEI